MTLRDTLHNEILPVLRGPSRYLGCELNAVHKDPESVDLRMALVFPDLYELGLGNLGLQILYGILNDLPWCWAERAYAPPADMEAALRERGLPLFAQESKDPLSAMDLLGFTLQSELTFTNVLNVIDLAGLPLRSCERDDTHPLVFAGGPGAVNPEPLAPFIDFFVIGDGEEVVVELAGVMRSLRGAGRSEKLAAAAQVAGVYVPALYPVETLPDGRILPAADAPKTVRRIVKNLDAAPYPTRSIVPFTQLVHDRIGLEVFRGCTHGCRFCQAGILNRPVRERRLDTLDALLRDTLGHTGLEEVGLLSLSTCDYTQIRALIVQAAATANASDTSVSLPSLRLDTMAVDLADAITGIRRSGLTFAPEAATPRLRRVINKWIPDEEVLDVCTEAFRRGWDHVKLYFMIGLPTETDEDIEAIADLCLRVLERGQAVNRRAKVFTSVSTFVPKPFTPFQWAPQVGIEETHRRQALLAERFHRKTAIKFGRHDPASTFIEGLIARGDRRTADLIEAAFRRGARFETDSKVLDLAAWQQAIDDAGYDVDGLFRARDLDERLPWDHIDVGVPKAWFQEEWRRALAGETTDDCRRGACNCCGLSDREPALCGAIRVRVRQAALEQDSALVVDKPERVEMPPVQRLRFRIGRRGEARFLSHLEWAVLWVRALRRVRAPLSYSQGFHAHPKVTFSTAAPVGEESEGDYMDIVLAERVVPGELLERLDAALPLGCHAFEVTEVPVHTTSLMSAVVGFSYTIETRDEPGRITTRIGEILAATTLPVQRKGRPKGPRQRDTATTVDLRPAINALNLGETDGDCVRIDFTTLLSAAGFVKPREMLELLGLEPAATRVLKRATYLEAVP